MTRWSLFLQTLSLLHHFLGLYSALGGGTPMFGTGTVITDGLSPRGRGNPHSTPNATIIVGSIPAWAGEPACPRRRQPTWRVYPRVGGGTASITHQATSRTGLSPRGRGNLIDLASQRKAKGSIPAWAGEPDAHDLVNTVAGVYPRVGGGTAVTALASLSARGLSPRGRGNRRAPGRRNGAEWSIPAWAGEPLRP